VSSSSRRSPRARWIVPVIVALIGAIGAVVTAVITSLLASNGGPSPGQTTISNPPPAPVEYQGKATLRGANPEIDLDSLPDGTGGDHVADLVHTAMALTTSKRSLIALLDHAQLPTPDTCRSALAINGKRRIAVSELETGFSLCIRTTAGHAGAITLELVRKYGEPEQLGQVTLSYRIWNVPAN
jgi:hypothetical protein